MADEALGALRVRRQANRLDVVGEAHGSLEFEQRQVVVESRARELRVNADLADLEDLALSRICGSQVEIAEAGRVLRRSKSVFCSESVEFS